LAGLFPQHEKNIYSYTFIASTASRPHKAQSHTTPHHQQQGNTYHNIILSSREQQQQQQQQQSSNRLLSQTASSKIIPTKKYASTTDTEKEGLRHHINQKRIKKCTFDTTNR